jgi:SNF2 family DNA or RNA helicase
MKVKKEHPHMAEAQLRDYQIVDLSFLIQERFGGLLHDPGCGKTPPVCVYLYYCWTHLSEKTIWVMPRQLMAKNKAELLRFTEFEDEDIVIVDGPKWREAAQSATAKVFLMGPTRFRLSWAELVYTHPSIKVLAADETHMYWAKHGSSSVSSLYACVRKMNSFVPMTGTVIKGRLDSAYPIIHAIEPRYYASYGAFMGHHEMLGDQGERIGWRDPERISRIIGRHAIKRSFESVYGPEAKIIVTETCEMRDIQREAYEEFEKRAILELEEDMLVGATGGVYALRCRQIMCHPETFGLAKGEQTAKDELLQVHLDHHKITGEPLVIFAAFKPEQRRIAELVSKMGMSYALLNGDVPNPKRAEIDLAFCIGKIQVIIGSPQVAVVGYNWSHVNHIIFASLDYGDDTFYQAYRRAIRGIREIPLLITVLEYARSVEQRIMMIIKRKSSLANRVDETREVYSLSGTNNDRRTAEVLPEVQ